jgi:hypothetical protein
MSRFSQPFYIILDRELIYKRNNLDLFNPISSDRDSVYQEGPHTVIDRSHLFHFTKNPAEILGIVYIPSDAVIEPKNNFMQVSKVRLLYTIRLDDQPPV